MKSGAVRLGLLMLLSASMATTQAAQAARPLEQQHSIADRSISLPTWRQWQRVILLEDFNTRVVLLGTTLLGTAAGLIGSFTLLRKRALMGDALSHATLPGIGVAFIVATNMGCNGKSLAILLLGATVTGLMGIATILGIRGLTRLKDDTAMGAVLSVYFGAGLALLGVIQQMNEGHAAGLESFIYGKTASMSVNDTRLIGGAALACVIVCVLFFKEFKLLCFDDTYAGARGMPVVWLDSLLMTLVVIVTIVGLQAVGLILMVALLVIPAAAARFWTEKLSRMFVISGALGAVSGVTGAGFSALFPNLPSGAMIVLVCTLFFLVSMTCGTSRGLTVRALRRRRLNKSVDRQHLLRAIFEYLEENGDPKESSIRANRRVSLQDVYAQRSWSHQRLQKAISRARRAGLLSYDRGHVRLTESGWKEAAHLTRQHRLWELYLITYADTAPSRVDREADAIEHVLEPEVIAQLEALLVAGTKAIPQSPHQLAPAAIAPTRRGDG